VQIAEAPTQGCDDRGVPRRVSSAEFVGRGPELAALIDAYDRASAGELAAVFLAGDSGVGKSRLLEVFEETVEGRGARVVAGDCVALADGELPYAPVRSALWALARELDPDALGELVGPGRGELARLVPELGRGSPGPAEPATSEPSAQGRLFELLLGLFARLGEEAPVVFAIEDIHWADRSTLDFLAFLASTARRERLLLVCTYRTDELHRTHRLRPFLAQHERPPSVERLDVRPFTAEELGDQMRGILGEAPDEALVKRVHRRTEGNAFFTEELLAASAEASELPASLRDALMVRIEVLPAQAQEVLRVAAAHGRHVTHRLLAAVCELPEPELQAALREAVAQQVLVQQDAESYAFRHALVQEALETELLPGERTSLHLALAEALEADPTLAFRDARAAAEVCRHWLGAHRLPEALAAAVRAGREAEQVYAFAEADHHLERALELWTLVEDAEARAGMDEGALYARAAECAYLGGDGPSSISLIRAAIDRIDARTDPHRAALVRERLGRYLFRVTGDTEGAQRAYHDALDLLPAGEPREELARVLAGLGQILMLRGYAAESMERCEQAIEVARRVGARLAEAHALNTLGTDLGFLGERASGIEKLRESLRIFEELGDVDGVFRSYVNLSDKLEQDGRLEEAVAVGLEGTRRVVELGMRDGGVVLMADLASRLLKLGRLDEADRLTEPEYELRPSLARMAQCWARAWIEVYRGRIPEAERLLDAAEQGMTIVPPTWTEPVVTVRVELELLRGQFEEARRLAETALAAEPDHEYVFYTARLHALGARASAELGERARAAGDDAAADEARTRAEALARRIGRLLAPERWLGTPPPEAPVYGLLCEAEARRAAGTATARDWAAVAERWAELGLPLDESYARLREAECMMLDGDRKGAEQALSAGLQGTAETGAVWLQGDLESLARRGRLTPSGAPSDDGAAPDAADQLGLTERELAVLELVAGGLTNREIGERLYISQKTASVHVSRILAKLGVSSRVEAATAAQRLGIVP
jgi:DNA-binding CsgD family transcriptional regulator